MSLHAPSHGNAVAYLFALLRTDIDITTDPDHMVAWEQLDGPKIYYSMPVTEISHVSHIGANASLTSMNISNHMHCVNIMHLQLLLIAITSSVTVSVSVMYVLTFTCICR